MPRRILEGNVVSAKNNKTVTVIVERRYMHPVYKKYLKSTQKFTAHDEANTCKEGERVQIIECRPLSRTKRWAVIGKDGQALLPPRNSEKRKLKSGQAPAAEKAESKKARKDEAKTKKEAAPKKAVSEKKSKAKKDA
ncbi:MAG: 30S ribosomal protein S17 [Alphaproteobacteria bacterium]|nr:30S ribosomal protein S17 [Alphaproteobacteria bacterium]MBP7758261.1 30S ribosomal protein S17 [Alphaproteobacteria bacterium]MBP7761596.1 30S ribosomal protein S17 [Alphaproteobacteria bacterium]MBP7904052.1 30S ribosomal protein S17 [Alphaproteobacteria bacterium]